MSEKLVEKEQMANERAFYPTDVKEETVFAEVFNKKLVPVLVRVQRCAKHKDLYFKIPKEAGLIEGMEGELYVRKTKSGKREFTIKNWR